MSTVNFKPKAKSRSHGRRARLSRSPTTLLGQYRPNQLSPHKAELREWFAAEISYDEILNRLEKKGTRTTKQQLSKMRTRLQREHLQEIVLDRIATGARAHEKVSKEFAKNPPPDVNSLVLLFQNLIFTIITKGQQLFTVGQVSSLMRPVLEWSRLQLKERETAVAERKMKLLEETAAKAREAEGVVGDSKLSQEEKMARMRQIFGIQPSAKSGG